MGKESHEDKTADVREQRRWAGGVSPEYQGTHRWRRGSSKMKWVVGSAGCWASTPSKAAV